MRKLFYQYFCRDIGFCPAFSWGVSLMTARKCLRCSLVCFSAQPSVTWHLMPSSAECSGIVHIDWFMSRDLIWWRVPGMGAHPARKSLCLIDVRLSISLSICTNSLVMLYKSIRGLQRTTWLPSLHLIAIECCKNSGNLQLGSKIPRSTSKDSEA